MTYIAGLYAGPEYVAKSKFFFSIIPGQSQLEVQAVATMTHRSSHFGSVSSRYGDPPAQRYYPGTYIDDHPRYHDERADGKAYRRYAGREYRQEGFDYVTTKEPFQPEPDYYQK